MADTSPGRVQALRNMFAQKNEPVMGCMKPGTITNRPWSRSFTNDGKTEEKQPISAVSYTAAQAVLRAMQPSDHNNPNKQTVCENSSKKIALKPCIGPKPFITAQQRTIASNAYKSSINSSVTSVHKRTYVSSAMSLNNTVATNNGYGVHRTDIGDAVASFMFGDSSRVPNLINDDISSDTTRYTPPPTSKTTATSGDVMKPNNNSKTSPVNSRLNLINSDNYICKSSSNFRRRDLPSKDKLGPPPNKPVKPYHLKLPEKYLPKSHLQIPNGDSNQENKPNLPPKRSEAGSPALPQKPPYPCPTRPSTSPPIPPSEKPCIKQIYKQKSLLEEIEQELYEDTLSVESSSMIPEYTEAEEAGDLYDDAITGNYCHNGTKHSHPTKLGFLPRQSSSCQSLYLEPNVNGGILDEMYHDTADEKYAHRISDESQDGDIYEIMPVEDLLEDPYSNNPKEIEKLKKEEEKRLRKEEKAKLKKEKEAEKLKKKFGLNGDETYIDSGLVKADYRGGRNDLQVKKGEVVHILRIEGNPVGKWLVKNKKGKYGFVDLTNIEVDPDSVKSLTNKYHSSPNLLEQEKNYNWLLSKFAPCVR